MKKGHMKKKIEDDMLPEYDFRKAERGKYVKRFSAGTNLIVLSPELVKVFPNSQSVNEALRTLVRISGKKISKAA